MPTRRPRFANYYGYSPLDASKNIIPRLVCDTSFSIVNGKELWTVHDDYFPEDEEEYDQDSETSPVRRPESPEDFVERDINETFDEISNMVSEMMRDVQSLADRRKSSSSRRHKLVETLDLTSPSKQKTSVTKNTSLDTWKQMDQAFMRTGLNTPMMSGRAGSHRLNTYRPNPDTWRDLSMCDALCFPPHMRGKKKVRTLEPGVGKKHVEVDCEIEDLADMIKLIEKYPLSPDIEYNVDMQAMHNIKNDLEDLQSMVGMESLKTNIVNQIVYFAQDLHKSQGQTNGDFLHTVIYGPPGTGKTEVAKTMGRIFSKLGILKKGTFRKVTRSDLIAGYLGQTAMRTRDVVRESLGGVLFIDEAYALGNAEKRDSFAKECIDTLCELLSDNKDNLMVIVAGYEEELRDCFFAYNQGLQSRFTWRFETGNYKPEELRDIFLKKISDIQWNFDNPEQLTVGWFDDKKDYFKYYGRDMETLLAKTKISHAKRVFGKNITCRRKLSLHDVDNGYKLYISNDEVRKRKEDKTINADVLYSMYS